MSRTVMGMAMLFFAMMIMPARGYCEATIIIPDDYPAIQAGIDAAADGDTVLVRDGTYLLENPLDFNGKAIIVRSEHGARTCILDGQQKTRVVYFQSHEGSGSILSGFTVQNGLSPIKNGVVVEGGGIYLINSSPTITDCVITANRAAMNSGTALGGGVYMEASSPNIVNCSIIGNYALSEVYGTAQGGGIYIIGGAPVISNIIVSGNTASSGTDAEGGGIYSIGSVVSIKDSTISTNSTINGYRSMRGGGMFFATSNPTIVNCVIYGNSADLGAGIYFDSSSEFSSVTNCTIVQNTAISYGGGVYVKRTNARVINSILWEDSPDELHQEGTSTPTVTFSDLTGGYFGDGNIDKDPNFVNVVQKNFRLMSTSTAINAGSNAAEHLPSYDKEGSSRIIDGTVEMGAYEYSSSQATDVIVYPQLAVGGGYEVVLIISNKSGSSWSGVGKPLQNDPSLAFLRTQITLGPKETKKFVLTGGSTTIACGYEIYGDLGSPNSAISVSFFYNYFQGEELQDSTGVPKSQYEQKYTFPVERASAIDTGLSIHRRANQPRTQVTLTLIDANGNQLQKTFVASDTSGFFSSLFTGLPASFIGSVVAESTDAFYMVVIRMENTETGFQLTSVPPDVN